MGNRERTLTLAQSMERQAVSLLRAARELREELEREEPAAAPANDALAPVALPQVTEARIMKLLKGVGYDATGAPPTTAKPTRKKRS